MKTHYIRLVFFSLILYSSYIGYSQDHKDAQVIPDPGTTLTWHPDGSVTVDGTATFISPIKKLYKYSDSGNHNKITTSNEMIIVDPDFYLTKAYTNKEFNNQGILETSTIGNNDIGIMQDNSAVAGYIDFAANSNDGFSKMKVFQRSFIFENDILNAPEHNFGFKFDVNSWSGDDDRWVIFGGMNDTSTSAERYIYGLDANDFSLTNKNIPYGSLDYHSLFTMAHPGYRKWWQFHARKHTNGIVLAASVLALTIIAPEIIPDLLDEEGIILGSTSEIDAIASKMEDGQNELELLNKIKRYETLKNLKTSETVSTISNKIRFFSNILVPGEIIAIAAFFNDKYDVGSSQYGKFYADKNATINSPSYADLIEYPVDANPAVTDDGKFYGSGFHECFTPTYQFRYTTDNALIRCSKKVNVPVVVKIEVKDGTLRSVNFPGLGRKKLTPYEMFKNLSYFQEDEHTLKSTVNGYTISLKSESTIGFLVEDSNNVIQDIPQTLINRKTGIGAYDVEIEFNNNPLKSYSFMLISSLDPIGIKNLLPYHTDAGYSIQQMGPYTQNTSPIYNLYSITLFGRNTLTLPLDENTYLAGTDIIIKNYDTVNNLFVGQDTNSLPNNSRGLNYKYSNGNTVDLSERPWTRVVVSRAAVSILDDDFIERDAETLATDKFGLYVGAVGEAESGILTNNAALLDVHIIPDFVFEDQYSLTSLQELETFVKANKHLPYVPNQQDYKADGFYSTGQMMMGQLQNLEELYLHTFSQDEQIKALDKDRKAIDKDLIHLQQLINQLQNPQ